MPTVTFAAPLYIIGSRTIIHLPKEASLALPSRGQIMAKGTLNGAPFLAALEPDGKWSHWLNVDAALLATAQATVGDSVTVTIEPTKDWPEPTIPADWQTVLDTDEQILMLWTDITPMARWEWLRWIGSTNNAATRAKRIETSCSKLMAGGRRPCCFNRNMCCAPDVSKNGVLLEPTTTAA